MGYVKVSARIYNPRDPSRYVERDVGIAEVEVMGRRGGITVIFGEDEDTPVISVTALESLGLEVDPMKGALKEAKLYLL